LLKLALYNLEQTKKELYESLESALLRKLRSKKAATTQIARLPSRLSHLHENKLGVLESSLVGFFVVLGA